MGTPIVRLHQANKVHSSEGGDVHALRNVDLTIEQGESVAIVGPSGSGKSTLLQCLGLMDSWTSGEYWLDGVPVHKLRPVEYPALRNEKIGFVFQQFYLIADLNAWENVELPLLYRGMPPRLRKMQAMAALESLGLAHRAHAYPRQLSGGEQQRVAVARAMVGRPKIVLADEPTGNLDTANGSRLMSVLLGLECTLVVVTHNTQLARQCSRVIRIEDGRLEELAGVELEESVS